MSNLEDLPLTAVSILVELLSPIDVMNLRLGSRCLLSKVDSTRGQLQQRLKYHPITFDDFEEFVNFNSKVQFFPVTNFSFKFDPLDYLDTTALKEFLDRFGPSIWKINIPCVVLFMSEKQVQFFEMMPNLKELIVLRIKLWKSGFELMMEEVPSPSVAFPKCLSKLEKFWFYNACDGPMLSMFLHKLLNLSSLNMGSIDRSSTFNNMTDPEDGNWYLIALSRYLRHQFENKRTLRYLCFPSELDYYNRITEPHLVDFVKTISKSEVVAQCVSEYFVLKLLESQSLTSTEKQTFSNLITQMNGFCPLLSTVQYPGLKTLSLKLSQFMIDERFEKEYAPSTTENWCNIENIFIRIQFGNQALEDHSQSLENLWSFIFGCQRPSVQQIRLDFNTELYEARYIMDPLLVAYTMEGLKSVCLKIPFYNAHDYSLLLHRLAENAPGICQLEIKVDGVATNEIFIGPDPDHPTILRMENLRHLKIEHNLNQYKRIKIEAPISQDCMRNVFPQTLLTCLVILGTNQSSIFRKNTERAQAFLDGNIAKTLRVLSWPSNDDDTVDVFQELKAKVSRNFNAVTSIIHRGLRCRICENYEQDPSDTKKWFQYSQIM